MTKPKISEADAVGLRTWRDTAKEFIDDQFPKARVTIGITVVDGSREHTLSAEVRLPCPYPEEDMAIGFELLGIAKFSFTKAAD